MPTAFWRELRRRGVRLLEVPEDEFLFRQATNVLAVAPRRCIMLEGSPVTLGLLREAGCEVFTVPGDDLSARPKAVPLA